MMKLRRENEQHTIDTVFTLSLLCVFAATALLSVILGARIYRQVVTDTQNHYTNRTALNYISEKIRQQDGQGSISVEIQENVPVLTMRDTSSESSYVTRLYLYDGYLKELYSREEDVLSLSSGQNIVELSSLFMEEVTPGLFHFQVTDETGNTEELYLTVSSLEEVAS